MNGSSPVPAHAHVFLGASHEKNERKTWMVIGLCLVMMLIEMIGGSLFGSLALIADGLHMATHAGAMLIAALAYTYARRHVEDRRFVFGTGKLGDLAGFSSAIILGMVALLIGYEAVSRWLSPVAIDFNEAIPVAVLGLGVNLLSAWMLSDHDHAHHAHARGDHDHASVYHRDHNIRAAFAHVLADAAVSVLAIVGLCLAKLEGWLWMDPLAGMVGALVIGSWSYTLVRDTARNLLDMDTDECMARRVKAVLESDGDWIEDLHVWRLGPGHMGVMASVVTRIPHRNSRFYHQLLRRFEGLSHITVEVHTSPSDV